jgi:hypothetical protein|tara:strand:+ start:134 stop:385 length:252 start_codon:yes stop_codon:yes gene_type:complete
MSEEIKKVTEEELTDIKEKTGKLQQYLVDLGALDIRKEELKQAYGKDLVILEDLKKVLEEKYGQVNINLADGSYTEVEKKEEE